MLGDYQPSFFKACFYFKSNMPLLLKAKTKQ